MSPPLERRHWTERSILKEVRERVAELFSNQAIDMQGLPGRFSIKECRSTTGDVSVGAVLCVGHQMAPLKTAARYILYCPSPSMFLTISHPHHCGHHHPPSHHHKHAPLSHQRMQAFTTMRKGNKRLVVFDLKITLAWEGQLAGVEEKVGHGRR